MNNKVTLPALSVQAPFGSLIISGKKRIETRTYSFPQKYLGKEIFLVETPGKDKTLEAKVVGIIRIDNFWPYKNEMTFRKDESLHLVKEGSLWDWQKTKPKWAWEIEVISKFSNPKKFQTRLGIRFTKNLKV